MQRLLLVVLAACCLAVQAAAGESLRIGGSGSTLGTARALGAHFVRENPEIGVQILPNLGSAGALKALAAGQLEIALVSRMPAVPALKPEELALGLKAFEYGRTPFVLVTSRTDLNSITLADAVEIVAGNKTRWPDGNRIRFVLRPPASIDAALLASMSPAMRDAQLAARNRDGMIIGINDQAATSEIERLPGGFGTSTLSLVRSETRKLNVLALDGVVPSPTSLADGSYRHMKVFYAVSRTEHPVAVGRFLELLRSATGHRILGENGHWVRDAVHDRAPRGSTKRN